MPWVKLDDAILDNPKILAAGPLGFALHVAAICYCARNLTDGFLPTAKAANLLDLSGVHCDRANPCGRPQYGMPTSMSGNAVDVADVIDSLVELELWHVVPGGFEVHDFLEYNPSRAKVEADRQQAKEQRSEAGKASAAKRKQRNAQREPNETSTRSQREPNETSTKKERKSNPDPDPDPVPEITTTTPPRARTTAERVFCLVGDAMRGVDLQELEQVSDRIGKALDAMAPELLWADLDAEVSGWISDARLKGAAGRDRGDHWSSERLLLAVEAKAMQRIRFRPKDARNERERDRANGPRSSQRGQSGPEDAEELARSYAEDWARARAEAAQ